MPYADPREAKRARAEAYRADPEKFRERARRQYARDPELAKERAKAARETERRRMREQERERAAGAREVGRLLRETMPEPVPFTGDPAATDWHARAACVGMDPELFFARHVGAEALAACLGCPVRAECLGFALAFPRDHAQGLWGGVSQAGRLRLLRAEREESADGAA